MAEQQQYPLPNPGLPLGQQAVSPVAQTNPLQSLQQGGVQGFSLGLAARQQQALEQERQTQLMAAQYQAKAAQQKNMVDYLTTANEEFKTMADNNYAAAMDFYKEKMAPIHSQISQSLGMGPINATEINHEEHPLKDMEEFNSLMADSVAHPERASHNIVGMQEIANRPEIGKINREKIYKSMSTVSDQQKHQDELMQEGFQRRQQLRSDPLIQQVELKQSAAGSVYDQLKRAQDEKGNYNIAAPQLIDLYANIYRAQSGVGITGEALPMMDQKTAQGNYAKLAAYFGLSKNALPKELGDRLLHMSEQLGSFNEKQHNELMKGREVKIPGLSQQNQSILDSAPNPRGMSFTEMKQSSDAASKYQPNSKVFKSEADAEKARLPKGTIVVINGRRAQIN